MYDHNHILNMHFYVLTQLDISHRIFYIHWIVNIILK